MTRYADFSAQFGRLVRLMLARGRHVDEAEDAVQEAYARMLSYIAEGNEVREPEAFLTQVARNVSLDGRRRHGFRLLASVPVEELAVESNLAPDAESVAASEDVVRQTQVILDQMVGRRVREVFFLHWHEGYTYREIAVRNGITLRVVERCMGRAFAALAGAELLQQIRTRTRSKA